MQDYLQPLTADEVEASPPPPWGWSERFRMPLFKPGTRVRYRGQWETVSHVALRRSDLLVYLVGREEPVDSIRLELEPTVFTTLRAPEPGIFAG